MSDLRAVVSLVCNALIRSNKPARIEMAAELKKVLGDNEEQLEQQAKSIDELQKLVKDAADYLDINSQTVISSSSILHREFRSLATKHKTNKQDK